MRSSSHDLIAELKGTLCRCGQQKLNGNTFCKSCYFGLPPKLRRALYNRVGEGYEKAYAEACEFLGFELEPEKPRTHSAAPGQATMFDLSREPD